jgi:hypothetical protein
MTDLLWLGLSILFGLVAGFFIGFHDGEICGVYSTGYRSVNSDTGKLNHTWTQKLWGFKI